ncbi:PqiB family protein, partial [Nitratifractor sp.]
AGSVTGYHLSPSGNLVLIDVFVRAPYSRYVTDTTRFWNASGIDATIGTNGVDIRTESLTSILVGGIAFDNFDIFGKGHPVEEGHHFNLFRDIKEAHRVNYQKALYFWVYFDESIRGLKEGAPVEFRGVKIGEVVNYFLMGDARTGDFKIPILIKIEPERFNLKGLEGNATTVNMDEKIFRLLVQKGFRAQLENASLITGDLLINLDFFPDAKPVKLGKKDGLYILPSVPATIESLKSNLQSILDRIAGIPFESLGKRFDHILDTLDNDTIPALNRSIHTLDDELVPAFRKLITHTDATMNELRKNYIDANAQIRKRMMRLIDEIQQTTRSIRNLSDYLQRHPESLIRGK